VSTRGYVGLLKPFLRAADFDPLDRLAGQFDDAIRAADAAAHAVPPPSAIVREELQRRLDEAKAQFFTTLTDARDRLVDNLLSVVPIEQLKAELRQQVRELGLQDPRGLRIEATLGPLFVAANLPSVEIEEPRISPSPSSGPLPATGVLVKPLSLGPKPPNGFEARLDAGPIRGAGSLINERALSNLVGGAIEASAGGTANLREGIAGTLTANLGTIQVAALASLRRTDTGSPSFLAVLSAGFTPGIQLGFGFQLNRIGGLIGIQRRLDPVVLSSKLSDGSATAVLFPLDLGKGATAALASADQLFPPAPGSAVAGPTFRLAWLEVAGTGFVSIDAAVLIELPGPRRIAVVGVLRAGITQPIKLVQLRADFAGVVDFTAQRATFDAALVDSGVLGVFTVYGDLAFATSWGTPAYTVLTFGGFYPGFRPEPAQLRPLKRLGFAPNVPTPGLRIRGEGYLAATSNTLQLGGRLEVGVDAGIASVSGFIGVDALIQFSPFHLHAQVAAGLDVRFLGHTFGGVRFDGTIDGPGPMTLHGKVTVETFFKDFDWEDTFTFGQSAPPPQVLPRRALDVLRAEECRPENLRAFSSHDSSVVLAAPGKVGPFAVVNPTGSLEWSQRRVPLQTPVDRLDGRPLGSTQTVSGRVGTSSEYTRDRFAPGSFITLTAAQALAAPAFDLLPGGMRGTLSGVSNGNTADGVSDPQVMKKVADVPDRPLVDAGSGSGFAFAAVLLAMVGDRDRDATVADRQARVTLTEPSWVATSTVAGVEESAHASATQAVQAALSTHGMALSAADHSRPIALSGLRDA
jgi:hypothetical protein